MTTPILELIERDGFTFTGKGNRRTCKEHDSLVVRIDRNRFYFNSRGLKGGPIDWLVEVKGYDRETARALLENLPPCATPQRSKPAKKEQEPTPEEKIAALTSRAGFYHDSLTPEARAYWRSQGISDASIDEFKLGYTDRCPTFKGSASYSIPYWDRESGRVINLRHRLIDESKGRYRPEFKGLGVSLFDAGLERRVSILPPGVALLPEGEKKAIVLAQHGFRCAGIAGVNAWLPEFAQQFVKAGIDRVYIILDPPGQADKPKATAAANRIRDDLRRAGIKARIIWLPGKPDDLLNAGMSAGELLKLIRGKPGLKPFTLSPEARERRDRTKGESKLRREERDREQQRLATEMTSRREADSGVAFLGDMDIDPEEVRRARSSKSSAKKWKEYVEDRYPDLDPERQYQIKLAENREARPEMCGEIRKRTLPNGQVATVKWTCGACDRCLSGSVALYRRALNEIQGIEAPLWNDPTEEAAANIKKAAGAMAELTLTELEEIDDEELYEVQPSRSPTGQWVDDPSGMVDDRGRPFRIRQSFEEDYSRPSRLAVLEQAPDQEPGPDREPHPKRQGEPAPPLARVHGPLSLLTINSYEERVKTARRLRYTSISYRCQPIEQAGRVVYDFLVNSDEGEPLDQALTDERLKLWVKGAKGNASGGLLPGLRSLQNRYRTPAPYEVVMPEMQWIPDPSGRVDEEGKPVKVQRPVDEDILTFHLPDIGTEAKLPAIAIDYEVTDPATLQKAIEDIYREQVKILGRRGSVKNGVCTKKKFYTRISTLPYLLKEFNERNDRIKAKQLTA